MSYAIFRVQGIKTTSDLKGIGMHNKERISHTNDEIDKSRSKDNIILIDAGKSYKTKFNSIVSEMKKEHEERMETMRKDRVKTFEQHINSSKNDVATEFVFTSDEEFFKDMSKEQIKEWGEKSLDFVINDFGIDKKNIIEANIHMDEKVPHLHIVAVPLVKKYNKKQKKEVWNISRRHFMNGREDLSKLQDVYHQRMVEGGYNLERGEKGSSKIHTTKAEYVAQTIKLAENVKKGLDEEIKAFKSNVERIKEFNKIISSIEVKKGILGKVSMSEKDFDNLFNLANSGVAFLDEFDELKKEILSLKNKNSYLESRVKDLSYQRDKVVSKDFSLEKDIKVLKDKNLKLGKANNFLKSFIKENNLVEQYNDKVRELNQSQERPKEVKRNIDLGMER